MLILVLGLIVGLGWVLKRLGSGDGARRPLTRRRRLGTVEFATLDARHKVALVCRDVITSVDAGGNMAAPLLAEAVGGTGLLGFIAAVAFATILAVVAGLTLSGAAALSHDLWVSVARKGHADHGEQLKVARTATVVLSIVAILLGIAFKGQNVAFMVGLAFAVAASGNFPALVLSLYWRHSTTNGMVASIIVGTTTSLLFIYLSRPFRWIF